MNGPLFAYRTQTIVNLDIFSGYFFLFYGICICYFLREKKAGR